MSSLAVAGLAVTPVHAQMAGRQLFIGFAPRVSRRRASGGAGAAVFAAETIGRTEGSFIRTGARFSVRGFRRVDQSPLTLRFTVMHQADDLEAKVPFYAWSYEGSDYRASSPIAFNVPVDPVQPLDVVLTLGGVDRIVSFSVAQSEGAIALNPGSYIFAIGDRAPDWSSLVISDEKLTIGDGPVPFDYLVLSVTSPES